MSLPTLGAAAESVDSDPFLWLEEVESPQSLEWARAQNEVSLGALETAPDYETLRGRLLAILNSTERIPYVSMIGGKLYNFWRDAEHPRGVWRRTSFAEYRESAPRWETVLDLDALAAAEGESWVWQGAVVLESEEDRCLIRMSRGGADATVVREFDLVAGRFVDGGFLVPEARNAVSWIDRDTLYIGSDFGPGTLTDSGYARQAKRWRRGTPLVEAELVFEAEARDVGLWVTHQLTRGRRYDTVHRAKSTFANEAYVGRGGRWVRIEKPDTTTVGVFGDVFTFRPREAWTVGGRTYAAGSLLAAEVDDWLAGEQRIEVVFEPTPRTSLAAVTATKNALLLTVLDQVAGRALVARREGGTWQLEALPTPPFGTVSLAAVDAEAGDEYFMIVEDFTTPTRLLHGVAGSAEQTVLKTQPAFYDATGVKVEQREAVSADGTRVPYFQVGRDEAPAPGARPTLLYGYGGFQVSMAPHYAGTMGAGWLERGGVYVLANIRGGGEFGPDWHRAALKENRQRAYDDFAAVAEDLIARGVTTPERLGIQGGSNGGLLVGVMLTQRPELFGAVVCQVPLLDMKRYHRLLAGASWMGEYGNPDLPEEWAWIGRYSPYQNVSAEVDYPRVFFTTSTRDDRVHPGHARKMAARMLEQGHDVLYYENVEGGHAGAANNEQRARMSALGFTFLRQTLEAPPARRE